MRGETLHDVMIDREDRDVRGCAMNIWRAFYLPALAFGVILLGLWVDGRL